MGRRMLLEEALATVGDGSIVGIGGLQAANRPVAAAVALAERGVRNLTLISMTGHVETEILVAAECVSRLRSSLVSLGILGLAPEVTSSIESGRVEAVVESEMTIVLGLRAAIQGVGFLPARIWDGTDLLARRPDLRKVRCPYTDEELVAVPPLRPDVALLHAAFADEEGNAVIATDPGIDVELARASRYVILTADRLVPTSELVRIGSTEVLGIDIDAVVECPGGALPTACLPHNETDTGAMLEALRLTDGTEALVRYWSAYRQNVRQLTQDAS